MRLSSVDGFADQHANSVSPTGEWSFPTGRSSSNTSPLHDENNPACSAVLKLASCGTPTARYGVTYKWRPDNADADLLTNSLSENILSPPRPARDAAVVLPQRTDCLSCHTPAASFVLRVSKRVN